MRTIKRISAFCFGGRISDWRSGKLVIILFIANALAAAQIWQQGRVIADQKAAIAYLVWFVGRGCRP